MVARWSGEGREEVEASGGGWTRGGVKECIGLVIEGRGEAD